MQVTLQAEEFSSFFDAPFSVYGDDSPYVSPLRSDLARFLDVSANPLFRDPDSSLTYWTAHRDGRPVGRITAHIHAASNRAFGLQRGYFGYFDCADDREAAAMLLRSAEDWLRARGCTEIMGNFNLTAMQQIGVVTDGFEHAPSTDLVWSPPHLPALLEANGYLREFGMTTFEVDLTTARPPAIGLKQQAILDDPAFSFAPIRRSTIATRMEEARRILNASFAKNPMFVPVSEEEFHFQAKDMKWVMDPRISAVLHHEGRPVACIICVPDLNPFLRRVKSRMSVSAPFHFLDHRWRNRRAVLIFSGVIPEWQGMGVNPLVLNRVVTAAKAAGYEALGNTWIGDSNGPSLAQKEKSGARKLHRLHLFSRPL